MTQEQNSARPLYQRWLAGALSIFMGFAPIATPVYAAGYSEPTKLADGPINVKNKAKPNIILTIDDSTSMLYDFLPDYVVDKTKFCRDGGGVKNSTCGFTGFIFDATAQGSGKYLSPEYIWSEPGIAFPLYDSRFDKSGPGAGCNMSVIPPTCTGGIDTGPAPGITMIPVTSGSPTGGSEYPYWQLWPAPAHNAAMNHVYYNPRLQYDPPAYPDASSFPQMTSANTNGWKTVPADPYFNAADPLDCKTAPCVDLTALVTVGLWCNSDWTQGNDDGGKPFVSNPAYCRTNGVVAAAASGAPAATGDYLYPRIPPDSTQPRGLMTPAVTSVAISYIASKVDMAPTLVVPIPGNATVRPNWDAVKNTKYFFQNENVLWCDITSSEWPQTTSNPVPQTCDMGVVADARGARRGTISDAPLILAAITQTCDGYRAVGSCSGAVATGNCAGNVVGACNTGNGTCAGSTAGACNTGNGTCAGVVAGACNTGNGTCAGVVAGACNTANGNCNGAAGVCNTANGNCSGAAGACNTANGNCGGFVAGTCTGFSAGACGVATTCSATREACVAGTSALCGGINPQTCTGTSKRSCDDVSQSCQGAQGAQTCANIVPIPPDPATCSLKWIDPDGNPSPPSSFPCPNPDPEGRQCTLQNVCPPPTYAGKCSKTNAVCAADADCPFIYGTCSTQTSKQCTTNTDCTGLKYCQGTTSVCATSNDCPNVTGSGKCSVTNATCTTNSDCPSTGTCNYQTTGGTPNGVCANNSDCKAFPNHCATTIGTTCAAVGANSASCPIAAAGICNYSNGFSGGACNTVGDCSNRCSNAGAKVNTVCAIAANCTNNGSCTTGLVGNACTINSVCDKAGACTTGSNVGVACNANGVNATCGPINKCTAGLVGNACTLAAQCNGNGTCTTGTNIGVACTGSGANATCGAVNKCTAGLVGSACTTNAQCNGSGTCTTGTNTGVVCTGSGANATCGPVDRCTAGKPATTVCTVAADCNVTGTCSTGANTGVACTPNGANATCGPVNKCSAGKPATTVCTLASQCNVSGTCTTGANTGVACATNGANATCGAVNKCTAGLPATTVCTTAAMCNINGSCTSGANTGTACMGNGANATCGAVNKCTAGNVNAACTLASQCNVTGACTSGNVGFPCGTNGTTATCAVVNGFCTNYPPNTQACTLANALTQCAGSTGHCSVNTTQTCTSAADCPAYGRCSRDNKLCTSDAQCPATPGPKGPTNATCDDATTTLGKTLIADANSDGVVCRRNNHTYSDAAAGQLFYPSGRFTTPVLGERVAGAGCSATTRYTKIPRHYWKTEVEWCDKAIGIAPDPWLGYGTPDVSCQESYDAVTHPYPRFYQFGGAPTVGAAIGTDNVATPAFARVDLDITKPGATFTAVAEFGSGLGNVTRDFGGNAPDVSEMTNYANWFAYYRTRILAVKSVTSLAFLGKTLGTFNVDTSYRVGFHTLFNTPNTSFVNIADFNAGQKTSWAKQLFAIDIPLAHETPTLDAMARIGEYFVNGTSAELPGSTDPIILSCQKNWHMLFTDGFTNQNSLPKVTVDDQDDVVPNYPDFATKPIAGLVPGAGWPAPLREDAGNKASNALSDYAMNYWVTDLRKAGPMAVNNVPGTQNDPATWQHLNFAALALGTAGTLPPNSFDTPPYPQWPKPVPTVLKPDATGVDDLWHAATNGRGAFINAQSADELKLGMGSILADIANQSGARAGAGFQSANITGVNSYIYRALFQPGWYGTLTKIQIDPVTGAEVSTIWEAANQLQAQLTVIAGVKDTPWFTERNIATMDAKGNAIPFLWADLSAAQQDSLAPGKVTRSKRVLEWIRGNTRFEGKKVGQLRSRFHALVGEQFLGDIVDAKPVYVGPPNKGYSETSDPGYAAFTIKYQGRSPMVYAGANDGMLHAFADATGNEAFAYVPSALYRGNATGLGALTYQDGALPPFTHHFLVDSTPKPWDVDFGGQDWRTVLVGGLGKGGNSYYALDITDPASITTEAKAVASVLWEFTDANLGYTYGQPTIVKTHATSGGFSAGQWVAIIPSGYDNVDGVGRIFFVDIKTGAKLKEMSTGFGNASAPAGLAQIAGYTKDVKNQLVEQVYGGDLYGNFWRFDLRDPNPGKWVLEKLATFTDPGGAPQPVTIAPQIEVDVANGVDRWVFIGTGRLLDDTDLAVSQQQTLYAIRDGDVNNPLPIVKPLAPRTDMTLLADRVNGLKTKPDIGWYDDLPSDQRIVVPLQAEISVVAYIGTSPQTDPCLLGQPATVYARGFARGDSLLTDTSGNPVDGIYEAEGGVGLQVVQLEPAPGSSLPNIQIAITLGTGKTIFIKPTLPPFLGAHRMSWRLLGQ
ncbi:MAG: hypothetical protein GZ089_02155 [Aromatoleum sp.]|nr:hypothetical protein [Aromatoleum sp.]